MRKQRRGQTEVVAVFGCIVLILMITATVLIIVLGGLWRTEVSYSFPTTVTGKTVPFEEDLTSHHYLFALVRGGQVNLNQVLGKYVTGGAQIKELTIMTRHTFVNSLLTGITVWIYCPVTVTVRGEFITPEDAE